MPLIPAKDLLKDARAKGYCLAGFDVFNLELFEAVLRTCERRKSPVMVQTSFVNFDFYNSQFLCNAIVSCLKSVSIPAIFHLDHGIRPMTVDIIHEALDSGFSSVMADGAHLPFNENVKLTQTIVSSAKAYGASVEGELGQVSRNPEDSPEAITSMMTDPDQAREFVEKTQIDSLAVSVGSITACFDSKRVELDLDRLERISRQVSVPLVFHGGTGIPDDQLREAISLGVAKVNVAHGLRKEFVDAMRSGLGSGPEYTDPRPALADAMNEIERYVEQKLVLFNSIDKA